MVAKKLTDCRILCINFKIIYKNNRFGEGPIIFLFKNVSRIHDAIDIFWST